MLWPPKRCDLLQRLLGDSPPRLMESRSPRGLSAKPERSIDLRIENFPHFPNQMQRFSHRAPIKTLPQHAAAAAPHHALDQSAMTLISWHRPRNKNNSNTCVTCSSPGQPTNRPSDGALGTYSNSNDNDLLRHVEGMVVFLLVLHVVQEVTGEQIVGRLSTHPTTANQSLVVAEHNTLICY